MKRTARAAYYVPLLMALKSRSGHQRTRMSRRRTHYSKSSFNIFVLTLLSALVSCRIIPDRGALTSPLLASEMFDVRSGLAVVHRSDNDAGRSDATVAKHFRTEDVPKGLLSINGIMPLTTPAIQRRTVPRPVDSLNLPPGWIMLYSTSSAFIPIEAAATALLSLYNGAYTKAVLWTIRSFDPEATKMTIVLGDLKLTFLASKAIPGFSTFVALFSQRMIAQTLSGYVGRYRIDFLSPVGPDQVTIQVILSVLGDQAGNIGVSP